MPVGILIAITALSAASSYSSGRKLAKEQKEASAINKAQQEQEAIRMRRSDARKARVMRAQLDQDSANTGTAGSSGQLGALSSIATKQGAAGAYLSGSQLTADALSTRYQNMADIQFKEQTVQNVLSVASAGAQAYMGMPKKPPTSSPITGDEYIGLNQYTS